ncbi:MAG: hypothetical protein U0168_18460 [Nannocystaceae bacterium]
MSRHARHRLAVGPRALVTAARVRLDRQHVGRAVADLDRRPGTGQRHEAARHVAHRMIDRLPRCRDATRRGEVVDPQRDREQAIAAGADARGQLEVAVAVEHDLRDLDHELELQRALGQTQAPLASREQLDHDLDVVDVLDLGQGDAESRRDAAGALDQGADEAIERRDRAARARTGQGFDADAGAAADAAVGDRVGQRARARRGVGVLLGVGADAIAVLEVDAQILDRRTREPLAHAGVDRPRQRGLGQLGCEALGIVGKALRARIDALAIARQRVGAGEAQRSGQLRRILRPGREGIAGGVGEPPPAVGPQQVRTPVQRVHRLHPRRRAAIVALEGIVGPLQAVHQLRERIEPVDRHHEPR